MNHARSSEVGLRNMYSHGSDDGLSLILRCHCRWPTLFAGRRRSRYTMHDPDLSVFVVTLNLEPTRADSSHDSDNIFILFYRHSMLSKIVLALIVAVLHIGTWLIGPNKQDIHVQVSLCRKHDFFWRSQPTSHVSCFLVLTLIFLLNLCK